MNPYAENIRYSRDVVDLMRRVNALEAATVRVYAKATAPAPMLDYQKLREPAGHNSDAERRSPLRVQSVSGTNYLYFYLDAYSDPDSWGGHDKVTLYRMSAPGSVSWYTALEATDAHTLEPCGLGVSLLRIYLGASTDDATSTHKVYIFDQSPALVETWQMDVFARLLHPTWFQATVESIDGMDCDGDGNLWMLVTVEYIEADVFDPPIILQQRLWGISPDGTLFKNTLIVPDLNGSPAHDDPLRWYRLTCDRYSQRFFAVLGTAADVAQLQQATVFNADWSALIALDAILVQDGTFASSGDVWLIGDAAFETPPTPSVNALIRYDSGGSRTYLTRQILSGPVVMALGGHIWALGYDRFTYGQTIVNMLDLYVFQTQFLVYRPEGAYFIGTPDGGVASPIEDALCAPDTGESPGADVGWGAGVYPQHLEQLRTWIAGNVPYWALPYPPDPTSWLRYYWWWGPQPGWWGEEFYTQNIAPGLVDYGFPDAETRPTTWARALAEMIDTPTYDIDVGEIDLALTALESMERY